MKKCTALLLVCFAWVIQSQAQDYMSVIKSIPAGTKFEEVSGTVDGFFRNNPEAKGRKQWERWKWYAERHLDVDGQVGNITKNNMEALNRMNISTSRFGSTTRTEGVETLNGSWSPVGPFSIAAPASNYLGRVNCVAFHPSDANTLFAGTPGGGLWKTTNGGTSWTPLTDGLPSSGISGIAIQSNNPNVMYVLTGDGNGGNQWGYYVKERGCGVYKSTDGGVTWLATGLSWNQSDMRYGYKLLLHPTNSNVLVAATSNGIYRTTNGGTSWSQEISGEFQDIEFKANDASKLCATRYGVASLYVSTDTGNTWVAKAYPGAGGITRGEVEVSDANPALAWVLLGPQGTGTIRGFYSYNWSTEVFTLITNTPNLFSGSAAGGDDGGFPWWAIGLWVSPTNANNMLMGGVIGRRSTTGGSTWFADNDILHADAHGYFTNPLTNSVYAVNDGGIFRSTNSGDTWTNITSNMQITQYYRMSGIDSDSDYLLAGAQDNGHHLRTTNTTTFNHVITCCDGMDNGINYTTPSIMYGFTQYGGLNKSINSGTSFFGIYPTLAAGGSNEAWVTPFLIHTTTPTTLFYASINGLLRHTASGEPNNAWVNLGGGGGQAAFAMGTSSTDRGYVASNSTLRRTDNLSNAAPTWTIKSGNPGWPSTAGTQITSIEVNPDNSLEVWVTFSGYNAATKVIRSTDGGDNWTNMTGNLPNVPVHMIKFEDNNGAPGGAVYIGTDIGVFYRDNTTINWIQYGNGLPRTMITDLEVNETAGVITVSTYGRGFWRSPLYSPCVPSLTLASAISGSQYHQASSTVTVTGDITGGAGTEVFLKGGSYVLFNPGFEIKAGNEMKAYIGPCANDLPVMKPNTSPADSLKTPVKITGNEKN